MLSERTPKTLETRFANFSGALQTKNKFKHMTTMKLIVKILCNEAIIGAFKKSQPQVISFFKGKLIN